ncbi:hypothetical protein, partial [Xenorhabdus bovienii]|uniref:hypothetical protein n=1 Tax=Xenorhabdus bovienii TaxID=40576 RepID=UPI0023B2262A
MLSGSKENSIPVNQNPVVKLKGNQKFRISRRTSGIPQANNTQHFIIPIGFTLESNPIISSEVLANVKAITTLFICKRVRG